MVRGYGQSFVIIILLVVSKSQKDKEKQLKKINYLPKERENEFNKIIKEIEGKIK